MQHRDVMDEGDVAKSYADRHNQDALNRVLANARRPVGLGSEFCIDCEDEIPADRRQAQPGCTRCAECQRVHERLTVGV